MEIYELKEKWTTKLMSATPYILVFLYAVYKSFLTDIRLVYLIAILVVAAVIFLYVGKVLSKKKTRYKADIYLGETYIHVNGGLDGTDSYLLQYLTSIEDERNNLVLTFKETDVPLTIRKLRIPKSDFKIDDLYKLKCKLNEIVVSQPNKQINGTAGAARH